MDRQAAGVSPANHGAAGSSTGALAQHCAPGAVSPRLIQSTLLLAVASPGHVPPSRAPDAGASSAPMLERKSVADVVGPRGLDRASKVIISTPKGGELPHIAAAPMGEGEGPAALVQDSAGGQQSRGLWAALKKAFRVIAEMTPFTKAHREEYGTQSQLGGTGPPMGSGSSFPVLCSQLPFSFVWACLPRGGRPGWPALSSLCSFVKVESRLYTDSITQSESHATGVLHRGCLASGLALELLEGAGPGGGGGGVSCLVLLGAGDGGLRVLPSLVQGSA